MPEVELSHHAKQRAQQRGMREHDIALIMRHGTDLGEAVLLTDRATRAAIARLKGEIQRLEHLRGAAVIKLRNKIITVYRASPSRCKTMLRKRRKQWR